MSGPSPSVTPRDVLRYEQPTSSFLCPLSANIYGIDFLSFQIRAGDETSAAALQQPVIFQTNKDSAIEHMHRYHSDEHHHSNSGTGDHDSSVDGLRHVSYDFPQQFLRLKSVITQLKFKVGNQEVHNFRMIERHYRRVRPGSTNTSNNSTNNTSNAVSYALLKSYDFNFHFCIPNSINEWEASYDLPVLSDREIDDILAGGGTVSDSFYFVGDLLIMHNKASYYYH